MDLNTLRAIVTVLAFLTFVGIVWWAYHRGARKGFDEAAQLPFVDAPVESPVPTSNQQGLRR